MTYAELKREIAESFSITQGMTDSVIQKLATIINTEEKLSIPRLGTFKLKIKAARKCRNPKTGETVMVPEKTVLVFKASK